MESTDSNAVTTLCKVWHPARRSVRSSQLLSDITCRPVVTLCGPRPFPEWSVKPLVTHNINKMNGSILVWFNKKNSLWHFSEVACVWVTFEALVKFICNDIYPNRTKKNETIFMPLWKVYGCHWTDFHETRNWKAVLYVCLLCRILIKSVKKCGHYEWLFMQYHK